MTMFGNVVLECVNASLARAQFAFLLVLLALGKWECLNVCHFLDAGRERKKAKSIWSLLGQTTAKLASEHRSGLRMLPDR